MRKWTILKTESFSRVQEFDWAIKSIWQIEPLKKWIWGDFFRFDRLVVGWGFLFFSSFISFRSDLRTHAEAATITRDESRGGLIVPG